VVRVAAIAVSLVSLFGCATGRDYYSTLEDELNEGIVDGRTPESFARSWGLPDQRETVGRSEFWTYIFDHGTTRKTVVLLGVEHARADHHYDRVTLEFSRGVLSSWHVDVH
jgi:hypothetical protein